MDERSSYRWILDNADFQRWRDDEENRLLWIKGAPGKGKTMLLCGVINELKKSIADTDLLSFFFCQATDTLDVFPLQYHEQKEEVKSTLYARGQRFISLRG